MSRAQRRGRNAAWAAVIALLLAGLPASAAASSVKALDARALAILEPGKEAGIDGSVTVFRSVAVRRGSRLTQAARGRRIVRVRRAARLYWEDLAHGFLFPHPSRVLVLDARSGRVLASRLVASFPLVNRRRPAFVRTPRAYFGAAGALYDRTPIGAAFAAQASGWQRPLPHGGKADLKNDGVVTFGAREDPAVKYDFDQVGKWAKDMDVPHEPAARSEQGLEDAIRTMVTKRKRTDVLLFLSGHGSPDHDVPYTDQHGKQQVTPGTKSPQIILAENGTSASLIGPQGIARVLKRFPKATFKVLIDSCYAGRWLSEIAAIANVAVVATSTDSQNPSYVGFGASIMNGLRDWASPASGDPDPPDLAGGIRTAFSSDYVKKWAAWHPDALHPAISDVKKQEPPPPPPPPAWAAPHMSPIDASFHSDEGQTTYTETATSPAGKELTLAWSLAPPPNDPGCAAFAASPTVKYQAIWHHLDSDGCDHSKQTARGHDGTVTVVVTDGAGGWRCTASYNGTITGTGPAPAACVAAGS